MTNIKTKTAAVATAVGLSLGGAAYATAASTTAPSTTAAPQGRPHETELTGDVAAKVKAAALAKVPGATVLRVETDAGGVYEAHVRKSDGTEVEVHVDKDYDVTGVDTRPAGGRGHVDAAAIAKALGQPEADVQAVLDANRPDRSSGAGRPGGDRDALAKALAAKFGITQDKAQAALDAQHPDHP